MQNFEYIIKKVFLTVILTVFTLVLVRGQTATVTINDYATTPGEIIIPVEVTNFNNVGAISIYIEYDQNVVTYQSFQNDALSGMQVNAFPSGNLYQIGISWTANSSGSTVNGTLIELVMNYSSGTTAFDFIEASCEIVDYDFNIIPVDYTDGQMSYYRIIEKPSQYDTINCYPNPVKQSMNIAYYLPENGNVKLSILNTMGDMVAELVDSFQIAGNYNYKFNPGNYSLPNGVYYCKIQIFRENGTFSKVVQIVNIK